MKNKLVCLIWILCLANTAIIAQDRPNIIFIVADDLGFGDLGITGSTQIKTPNIDKLATSGIICSEGYVSSAVCSPSRAGMLTGLNQVEFGYDNNISGNQPGFDPEFLGLPENVPTIATYLKTLGYTTGLIGKWHLGDRPQFQPKNRGFDEYWTYEGGGHNYFELKTNGKDYFSPIQCNYKVVKEISYITDDKGNECVEFINRNMDKPFFLFASFNAPHAPMQALEEDMELYSSIENKNRRTYAAMVHRLDVNVGKIVSEVKKLGLLENTIFVFISDNGGPVDSNGSLNAPYRGQKGILLEGGIHVPFFISWQNHLPAGVKYDKPVSSLDLTPTFYAIAGGKLKGEDQFDGVNLIPYLQGKNKDTPHETLMWKFTISASIREGDWKLIRLPDRIPMLYNLSSDISEQKDLALDSLSITQNLLKKLGIWDATLPHPLFLEGAEWKMNQLHLYDNSYQLEQP